MKPVPTYELLQWGAGVATNSAPVLGELLQPENTD
jgi:hypothetical protein